MSDKERPPVNPKDLHDPWNTRTGESNRQTVKKGYDPVKEESVTPPVKPAEKPTEEGE